MKKIISYMFIIYFTFFSAVSAQQGNWQGFLDALFGEKYNHALTALLLDEAIESEALDQIGSSLVDIAKMVQQFENGEEVNPITPSSPEEQREIVDKLKGQISTAQEKLDEFSISVAAGKYDDFVDREFWRECQGELVTAFSSVNEADLQPDSGAAAPDSLETDNFSSLSDCRQRANEVSASLSERISVLDEQIETLDEEIKKIDEQLEDPNLTDEQRDKLEKDKKNKEDERDQKKEERQKAEEAKSGVDLWLIVSGLVMIVAGLVLVYFYDITNGWALVSGGFGMIVDGIDNQGQPGGQGSEGGPTGDDGAETPGAETGTTDGTNDDPGTSELSEKMSEAGDAGSPDSEKEQSLIEKLKNEGFTPVQAANPGGNLVLFHNPESNKLAIYRIDSGESLLDLDLETVESAVGLTREGLSASDLLNLGQWTLNTSTKLSFQTQKGVSLTFEGSFEGLDEPLKATLVESEGSAGELRFVLVEHSEIPEL